MCASATIRLLVKGLQARDRGTLAKTITLLESSHPADRRLSCELMDYIGVSQAEKSTFLLPTFRIGVCGAPGAGKSSFIETIGKLFLAASPPPEPTSIAAVSTHPSSPSTHRVAVLPVDPSSAFSGGSILGDKVRMPVLSASEAAFIRASPSRGVLGGITEHTVDIITACEYADYDTIFVESVGIGQSELDIAKVVDVVVLVIAPGSGDDVQAMKRGILEVVDLIVVNKADGALLLPAKEAMASYSEAIHSQRYDSLGSKKRHNVRIQLMSSLDNSGVKEVFEHICELRRHSWEHKEEFRARRREQALQWMWTSYKTQVVEKALLDEEVKAKADDLASNILDTVSIRSAAQKLFETFEAGRSKK